jgi:hypothetical protein
MTNKEAFEKWYSAFFHVDADSFKIMQFPAGFYYLGDQVDEYWKCWQLSRAAALEEAAQVCDFYSGKAPTALTGHWIASVGKKIRERATDGSSEGEKNGA